LANGGFVIFESLVIVDFRLSIEDLVKPVGRVGVPDCLSVLDHKSSIATQQPINDRQSKIGQ
jgi:hypothetical protein